MDAAEEMVASLAVVADDELADWQRMVELFLQQGWMDAAEADRWRRLIQGRRLLVGSAENAGLQ